MGVMLLGSLVWLGLLSEMTEFHPARAIMTLGTGTLFLLMVFKDSAKRREHFFYAYVVNWIFGIFFGIN